jgi:hypothetical protein
MPEFTIPDYISDPPVDWRHYDRNEVARRCLKDLGPPPPEPESPAFGSFGAVGMLATRLGTSEERIGWILREAALQHWLNRALAMTFDPVPHEIEARRQFVHLHAKTRALETRSGPTPWLHPAHVSLASLHRELADYSELIAEWSDWVATWAALVARNPPLELRQRMGEVFDNHLFTSWEIGRERLLYDWLARGSRDPMPFLDHRGIISDEYYWRLCELRDLAGGGSTGATTSGLSCLFRSLNGKRSPPLGPSSSITPAPRCATTQARD